jgi:hypothetical protein
MTWNNVYLGTPQAVGNYQGSAASTVLSDLSVSGSVDVDSLDVAGTTTLSGALNSASAISGGAVTGTDFAATSKFSFVGSGNTVHGGFFSGATTLLPSLASVSMADGQFSIISLGPAGSATSCILAYRSGSTVYKFFAREAEGLSTTP